MVIICFQSDHHDQRRKPTKAAKEFEARPHMMHWKPGTLLVRSECCFCSSNLDWTNPKHKKNKKEGVGDGGWLLDKLVYPLWIWNFGSQRRSRYVLLWPYLDQGLSKFNFMILKYFKCLLKYGQISIYWLPKNFDASTPNFQLFILLYKPKFFMK